MLQSFINVLFWTSTVLVLPLFAFLLVLRIYLKSITKSLLKSWNQDITSTTVGFFHPFCNSGGGGERVLWKAISAIQEKHPDVVCVIYTGDNDISDVDIITSAEKRFSIRIKDSVRFVHLKHRRLLDAEMYPRFTMIGQSIGSMLLAVEAAFKFMPSIFFESTGFAFTMPIFAMLGSKKIGCYVHYPTISTDMLQMVADRTGSYNNSSDVSRSSALSNFKLIYYKIFAKLYGQTGRCPDLIMVNSSWTKGHILSLWQRSNATVVVYPPCNIEEFGELPIDFNNRKNHIVSIGQFRPEKDHELQIRSFKKLVGLCDSTKEDVKLILIGSCRNADDEARVDKLKKLCQQLDLLDQVIFKLNIPFSELLENLQDSKVGLHTMWNEHFGIGVVECMSAGLIMVAHGSGGPRMDIVRTDNNATGFLASDENSYSEAMFKAITMNCENATKMILEARKSVERFSDDKFSNSFLDAFSTLL